MLPNPFIRHLKAGVTLKQIRQTSGDMIKRQFGKPVADHFLGHGQRPVDASLLLRDQEVLDQAVAWLGDNTASSDVIFPVLSFVHASSA